MFRLSVAFLLLLCRASWAQNPACPITEDCVPFFLCVNGEINTSGADIFDIRVGFRPGQDPSQRSACTLPSDDGLNIGVCCRIPGFTNIAPCDGGKICVEPRQCKADGTINTDGSGIFDIRSGVGCLTDDGANGVCCSPAPQIIDRCPGDASCVSPGQCNTNALNTNGVYASYFGQGGNWEQCRISGQFGSNTGICCENNRFPVANQCGVRNVANFQTRITPQLLKEETIFGEYPWQTVLFFRNLTFNCGATLISEQWLITAAHCVLNRFGQTARLGEWRVNDDSEPLPPRDFQISKVVIHQDYNPNNLHNDIALLKLATPVAYDYHINRVCLPKRGQRVSQGTRCFATGWGKIAFDGQFQVALKQIDLPVVNNRRCQRQLRRTRLGRSFKLDNSFVCAGGELNKDVCKGDGGGPLVCQDPSTGTYFLYGITAWGVGCGNQDVPGVYVNVAKFSNWIRANMN